MLDYTPLINNLVHWAQSEHNIRAVMAFGSRARADHPADEWSDLDVVLFAHDPSIYWQTTEWLAAIGRPWLNFLEPAPDGQGYERRVLFAGGLDVDFVLFSFSGMVDGIAAGSPSPILKDFLRRGWRFLVDKDDLAGRIQTIPLDAVPYVPPDEHQFLNLVNDFWFHTVWTAKHARRGELWLAKSCCDGYLKQSLRQMLEWHAHSKGQADTWVNGHFLEEWADPRAVQALSEAFAHYDAGDLWRALTATMDLFHWLAAETASNLGYREPSEEEMYAAEIVRMLSEK